MLPYFNLDARVLITNPNNDKLVLDHIHSFKIEESILDLSNKATITIAKNYKALKGQLVLNYIKSGYPVEIQCGYNGDLQTEFTGYVKPGISAEYPVVIECDELFPLRQQNVKLSYLSITLRDLLTKIAPGYIIECPDSTLGKVNYNNNSPYQVLNDLKKKFGFYSRINGKILSVGWAYNYSPSFTKNYTYTIGKNVRDSKGLKYRTDIDFNVRVEIAITVHGKKKIIKYGSDNADAKVQRKTWNDVPEAHAVNSAKAIYSQLVYTGFVGNIKGFCNPRTHAGDTLTIIPERSWEPSGTYMIEKVETEYDVAHIKRINTLSYKIV